MASRTVGTQSNGRTGSSGEQNRIARPSAPRSAVRWLVVAALLTVSFATTAEAQSTGQLNRTPVAYATAAPVPPPEANRVSARSYTVAGLASVAATRQWPLMDGRTASRRFHFELRQDEAREWSVSCHRMTITGDAARNGSTLDCTLIASSRPDESWRLQLSGRTVPAGTLRDGQAQYDVKHASASELREHGGRGSAAGYLVYRGATLVAAMELQDSGMVWISGDLDEMDGRVLSATMSALLIGLEQRAA